MLHCLAVGCCLTFEASISHEKQVQPPAGDPPPLQPSPAADCTHLSGKACAIILLVMCHAMRLEQCSANHCALLQARAVLVGQWGFGQDGRDMGGTVCLFTGESMEKSLFHQPS